MFNVFFLEKAVNKQRLIRLGVVGALLLLQPCANAESAQTIEGKSATGGYIISGSGSLVGRKTALISSDYAYHGTGTLDGEILNLTLYQDITNPYGKATLNWRVAFDITTSEGTQTVLSCTGSALICGDTAKIVGTEAGTTPYQITHLDTSDPNNISWAIDAEIDVKNFGLAHTASSLSAVGDQVAPTSAPTPTRQ
jgi:hypothetical protein